MVEIAEKINQPDSSDNNNYCNILYTLLALSDLSAVLVTTIDTYVCSLSELIMSLSIYM